MADSDSENDLPESISFSTTKTEAIKQFQQSVKQIVTQKKRLAAKRKVKDEKQKAEKLKKEENEKAAKTIKKRKTKPKTIRMVEAGNTLFQIETVDNQLAKAKKIAETPSEFRKRHLLGNGRRRETAKSWLNKCIKRQAANRGSFVRQ